ncbi:DUF2512 family protein [Brevibacillus sp. SYSU BS000544]|uniref:DUF2512 family protein n=1 Tax=Brevibacillus sp. SYSU BS000544 TaxID=3416443 RepID=UPI003CE53232
MAGFIMKVIMLPIIVALSDYFLANVDYGSLYRAVMVGVILAIVGQLMEVMILKRGTIWTSTVLDFVTAFAVIYFSQYFFPGAGVTVLGAFIVSVVIGLVEYLTHTWLVRSGRAEKA